MTWNWTGDRAFQTFCEVSSDSKNNSFHNKNPYLQEVERLPALFLISVGKKAHQFPVWRSFPAHLWPFSQAQEWNPAPNAPLC